MRPGAVVEYTWTGDSMDTWSLVEAPFDAERALAYEGLFTQGSGYVHTRGSLEEHFESAFPAAAERPKAKWGAYIPGLYSSGPGRPRTMINLPFFLGLAPSVDGERLDMEACDVEHYRRELNMRNAVLARSLTWRTKSGAEIRVVFERFVSAARPHLCLQRMTLSGGREAVVKIEARVDTGVLTGGLDYFEETSSCADGPAGMMTTVRTAEGRTVTLVSRMTSPEGADWSFRAEGRRADLVAEFAIEPDRTLVVEKRTGVASSVDLSRTDPARLLEEAGESSYEELLAEHERVWRARWERSDVEIEGDDRSQLACRLSVYHLLRAHATGDDRVSIGAKAFSGDNYLGMFFWDTEVYILPFFLYTNPESARTLVEFRIRGLKAARGLAEKYGYRGARFPWMSDSDGNECCREWQYAQLQVHITADVVLALVHYARATGDEAFLRGPAAEVLVETARYWLGRAERRKGDDHRSLLGVMGPNEYGALVDNNAYTNRLAAFALLAAARIGSHGGAAPDECRAFTELAGELPVPRAEDGRLVMESDGFDRKVEVSIEELHKDKTLPFMWQVPLSRIYRSKLVKQADVILLMMLFPDEFTDEEVKRAWDYYLPITTHESSLSACTHAMVALRLGLTDEAWRLWKKSSETDLDTTRAATTGAAEGMHAACCGGNWQVAVFGFGGMSTAINADILTLRPRLPSGWRRLAFPVAWRGGRAYVEVFPQSVRVTNRGPEEMEVRVRGETKTVPAGQVGEFE